MSILEHFVKLQPYSNTQEEFAALAEAAREDGHALALPTDVMWKNGERVGTFSVQLTPVISAWFSTKKMLARDSMMAINTIEQVMYRTGARGVYFPVKKSSPFYPHMEAMGFVSDSD